jgi:hypothetical protein
MNADEHGKDKSKLVVVIGVNRRFSVASYVLAFTARTMASAPGH